MARVPYLQKSALSPEDQGLITRDINIQRAVVNSPRGIRAFHAFGSFAVSAESRLDRRLRELAILQVGYLLRSAYVYLHHIPIGRSVGLSDHEIRAVAEETAGRPSLLNPFECAILRAAREMTVDLKIADETFAALKEHLDAEQLTDLVLTIAFYNASVRVIGALEVDLEPEFFAYLHDFPMPAEPTAHTQ
jgi:alkylhydroperoxidase family enzyme